VASEALTYFHVCDRPIQADEIHTASLQKPRAIRGRSKHPGYDEDILIATDSRTLTLVHMGRLDVREAELAGTWQVSGPPSLVRAVAGWGGFHSAFAEVRPVRPV
jgi:hypothetical protein